LLCANAVPFRQDALVCNRAALYGIFLKAHLFGEKSYMSNSRPVKVLISFLFVIFIAVSGFSQADIPRRTTAVTYPLDEVVNVQFRGTTRFPRMKGEARVKRTSRNGTQIELSVSKMPRPFELGAGYATYVLWAISPDGQVDNLGEIKRRGFFEFDSKINVTTPLQTFALIITAEPHFLVRRPSQAIMLENLNPTTVSGKTVATTPSIQYFGNSSDYFRDSRTPEIAEIDYSKTPSTILQAKQAVALAKYAGADRDAADELKEAESLLDNAESSWKAGRDETTVDVTARKAISSAVKAESTAEMRKTAREQRNEKARADAETRKAEDRYQDAQDQIAALRNQLNDETRTRELSQRDVQNYIQQIKDLKDENSKLREDLVLARQESDNVKSRLAAIEKEQDAAKVQQEREQKLAAIQANEVVLINSLRQFGTVKKTENGIELTLPETYWSGIRASTFAGTADTKLASLGQLLAGNPDYKITVESQTDGKGTPEELQNLTQARAQALVDRFSTLGVAGSRLEAKGMGAALPIAPNTTTRNRARNRRVNLILSLNVQ
jgi:outer membrane protein OmpA-like peptidoglycan-associated protein